jgi:uncharacterized protein YutE (UPF0331/DUF86 family)
MYKVPLSRTKIESKLALVREALSTLGVIGERLTIEQFVGDPREFAVAEHHLRRALEAVFDIAGHIVSRFPYAPGERPKTIKEIARALGDKSVVDKEFAEKRLVKMAGYRNRLVHFYDEITPHELYRIVTGDLGDIEQFARDAVETIRSPERFGLAVEE